MRRVAEILLTLVAFGEITVGAALLLWPDAVVEFLLEAPIGTAGTTIARMAGLAIAALGLAWWPDRNRLDDAPPRQIAVGFIGYNVAVGLLFIVYAWNAGQRLPFAWLVGVLHLLVGVIFAVACRAQLVAKTG